LPEQRSLVSDGGQGFETVEVGPGITFRYLPASKWKTLSIDVFCKVPLKRETVTQIAMIPRMARRGTAELPTLRDISKHLEGMYGAGLGAEASKIGPAQVLRFGIDLPSPAFLEEGTHGPLEGVSLGKAMSFIWDVATRPYLENRAYPPDRFDIEREEQRRDILSIINHRPRYALVRLVEEMSRGSDTALPSWGLLEDLPTLDHRRTWETWVGTLTTCPISIYAIGEGTAELGDILQRASLEFPSPRLEQAAAGLDTTPPAPPDRLIEAEDSLPGEQTVLCMAYHTGVTERDPLLPASIMYDGILGGFPHSKLFRNVREKHSLAYFADSSLNTWRGMVVATAGIMDADRAKVMELVSRQVEALKRGEISDEEMDSTRAGLIRRYRSESDSQSALVRRFLTQEIMGGPATEEELVSRIERVTKDEIVNVAEKARLAAVYALRAKDDGRGG
jgi:predicted Zn-dependent peptidase